MLQAEEEWSQIKDLKIQDKMIRNDIIKEQNLSNNYKTIIIICNYKLGGEKSEKNHSKESRSTPWSQAAS